MGSGGDIELPSDRVTENVRIYRGDKAMIERLARNLTAERALSGRRITPADVVHSLLAPVRRQEQERGND